MAVGQKRKLNVFMKGSGIYFLTTYTLQNIASTHIQYIQDCFRQRLYEEGIWKSSSFDNLVEVVEARKMGFGSRWGLFENIVRKGRVVDGWSDGGRKQSRGKVPAPAFRVDSPAKQWGMYWHTTEPAAEE